VTARQVVNAGVCDFHYCRGDQFVGCCATIKSPRSHCLARNVSELLTVASPELLPALGREGWHATGEHVTVGSLRLSTAALEATVDGRAVRLTGTEFRVLELLMRGAGQAKSREILTERILGRTLSAHDRSIDNHISNLRRKLVDEHGRGIEIRNTRGAGYLLTGNVEGQA
jgi:DNA-binding response OmpR family regulator